MNQHVLLTGATGMLGKGLITSLLAEGYQVSILSRKLQKIPNVNVFLWDVKQQMIDANCLRGVDSIIHLAGEGIASEKWSEKRKKEIVESRVYSTELLYKVISETDNQVKHFISAAAVGFYGNRGDELLTEDSAPGKDFLAECCIAWERAVDAGEKLSLRTVKVRTGVVLDKDAGALAEMSKPINFFVGAPLGTGQQWIPWIHHQDMTSIYLHLLKDTTISGAYNACAPSPVTNSTLTKALARQLHRPVWPFNVPERIMNLILGEMSAVVLNSTNTSAQKLLNTGYVFKYTDLNEALTDIYA